LIEPLLDPREGLLDLLVAVLGLRASLVDQQGGEHDEGEQLEKLRLPVLERGLRELRHEVADLSQLPMLALLIDEGLPFPDALGKPRDQEQDAERDAQPKCFQIFCRRGASRRGCSAASTRPGTPRCRP
jgi:hypothetical protein